MTEAIKKTRTPKNADSITKGALALPLQERVDLWRTLQDSIMAEVETIRAAYEHAEKIANGNN